MKKNQQTKASKYKIINNFGVKQNQKINENDIITKVKFDKTGNNIAISDKAGRVIIFTADKQKISSYQYLTEFQCFQMKFDALNSENIQPQIKSLEWMHQQDKYNKIIVANDKKIKIWKFYNQKIKRIRKYPSQQLNFGLIQQKGQQIKVKEFISFPQLHKYDIHTISGCQNEQYLLSGDRMHCFLWNYQKYNQPYLLTDLLGNKNIQQINQNISVCKTHPINDNIFIYGTDKGTLKQIDLRQSSTNNAQISFKDDSINSTKVNKLLSIYSDLKYFKNGKYIISRDYLAVKIWDVCNPKAPLKTLFMQDDIRRTFKDIVQNQYYNDNFQIAVSQNKDSSIFYTGQYNNCFHLCQVDNSSNFRYQLSSRKQTKMSQYKGLTSSMIGKTDFKRVNKSGDFHPTKDILAVSMLNGLYIYGIQ